MRYGIFSDVHSNLEALEAVIDACKSESIDKYLCLGDVVGYAANPKECIEKINSVCQITIAGNHDWATVELFSVDYFNSSAHEAIIWTKENIDESHRHFLKSLKLIYRNNQLTLVHGTLDCPQDFNYLNDDYAAWETFSLLDTGICFVGHTHAAGMFIKDSSGQIHYHSGHYLSLKENCKYIINVGSVGQPRDGNPDAAYCLYDTDKKEIHIKRIGYDIQAARRKIIEKGLPRFLGDRLMAGR